MVHYHEPKTGDSSPKKKKHSWMCDFLKIITIIIIITMIERLIKQVYV